MKKVCPKCKRIHQEKTTYCINCLLEDLKKIPIKGEIIPDKKLENRVIFYEKQKKPKLFSKPNKTQKIQKENSGNKRKKT